MNTTKLYFVNGFGKGWHFAFQAYLWECVHKCGATPNGEPLEYIVDGRSGTYSMTVEKHEGKEL